MARSDPYAVLGLPPGAPLDEVKRAYRRLAKQLHPDTAGGAATTRFLAVQAAYESIAGNGGARPGGAPRPAPRPSQADPGRARATRDAYRGRTGRGWNGAGGAPPGSGGPSGAGQASGGSAGPGPGAWWRSGPPPAGGGTGDPSGAGTGTGPTGTGPSGAGSPGAGASGAASAGPGRRRRSGGRKKATLNSTTYDEALHEPFEPGWSGATWYGPSSGTYWTINPKEYADPRKHGPEYQARARRAAGLGATPDGEPITSAPPPEADDPDPRSSGGWAGGAATGSRSGAADPAFAAAATVPTVPTGSSPASAGLVAAVIGLIPALALLVAGLGRDEPVLVMLALFLPLVVGIATAIVACATGRRHA